MVAGFNTWKKDFQRTVNKGEKSLKIWMPFTVKQKDENGKIKLDDKGKPITFTGFKLGSVFDVSQTNGKDIPKALYELSETKEIIKTFTGLYVPHYKKVKLILSGKIFLKQRVIIVQLKIKSF